MNNPLFFQYCQKIILFNEDHTSILLARRKGEADYDGVYSFIGGKLETTDGGFMSGLQREKNEEIGELAKVKICPFVSYNIYFTKSDGSAMVLPHFYAQYMGGEIEINDEYSDYKWVTLDELATFEPKIDTIETGASWTLKISKLLNDTDFVTI